MLSKINKSEFIKNVFTLMTGTAIAQAIPFLISPILSRLYTPDDFGVFALFLSIPAVIGVISTGRYELAIMLPKEKRTARNIIILSLIIACLVSLVTFILIIIFKQYIIAFFEAPEIGPWLYLVPVMVLFMGIYQTFNYWSIRNKTFRKNAISRISQSGSNGATQLALGAANAGPVGLIAGTIIGQMTAAIILAWRTITRPRELREAFSKKLIRENASRYSIFLKINTPHAFIDSLQDQGIVYVVICFFSKMVLGSYAFAYRILKAPVGLIGNSIYQVFFQKASKAFQEGQDIQPMVLKIYRNLFLIGFPIFFLIFLFAPSLFAFVFGEEWKLAGEIAQIIIPWLFLNFMVMPVSCIAVVMNKQKGAFLISCADVLLKVFALVIGGLYGDFRLAFMIMSILCSGLLIFALYWYYKIAGSKFVNVY